MTYITKILPQSLPMLSTPLQKLKHTSRGGEQQFARRGRSRHGSPLQCFDYIQLVTLCMGQFFRQGFSTDVLLIL